MFYFDLRNVCNDLYFYEWEYHLDYIIQNIHSYVDYNKKIILYRILTNNVSAK